MCEAFAGMLLMDGAPQRIRTSDLQISSLSPVRDTTALPLEETADLGLGARMT